MGCRARVIGLLAVVFAVWLPLSVSAATVQGIRLWRAPDNTRIVFDLSGPIEHRLVVLPADSAHAQRIVVTFEVANIQADTSKVDLANTPINALIWETREGKPALRIDLSMKVVPKSFLLPANAQYGHRLVLDLYDEDKLQPENSMARAAVGGLRDVVIAVDAGHGGDDPGAKGAGGLYEKVVTLAIARELAAKINATPGYSAFLTRSGDYFVSLRGRTAIARRKGADLFVSIHADAFKDAAAQGAGVFALSERGATSETARWLAQNENESDLVGGVNLGDKDPLLQEVLLDLSITATVASSLDMGDNVLNEMKKVTRLHRGHVEQAGFVVLKNPDIPSLLVETGFITNATEARNLAKPEFRSRMAQAIFTGIDSHFRAKPPMDTALAAARGGTVVRTVDKLVVAPSSDLDQAIGQEESARAETIAVRRDEEAASRAAEERDDLARLVSEKETAKTVEKTQPENKPASKQTGKKKPAAKKKTKQHTVVKGETLSGIAARYKVSMSVLRKHNQLKGDIVRVGQKLKIPAPN